MRKECGGPVATKGRGFDAVPYMRKLGRIYEGNMEVLKCARVEDTIDDARSVVLD